MLFRSCIRKMPPKESYCEQIIMDHLGLRLNNAPADSWRKGVVSWTWRIKVLMHLETELMGTVRERIGQINALSVIEFPGHPRAFGEPSRISCVVHIGDGEFTDIERKAELGGNIHAKGMMIMQAFLMSELQLEQQIPFSASLTFEQSYSEVDGDSASMAELCALISALADVPECLPCVHQHHVNVAEYRHHG